MQYLDEFVSLFFDLLAYCEDKQNFDPKTFKIKHDFYSKKYAKLEQDEQGYITEQIYKKYGV
jgi:hypothetical protein